MSAHDGHLTEIPDPGPLKAPTLEKVAAGLAALGGLVFLILLFVDTERAWSSFLQGMLIPTYISCGALFFISAHAVGGAVWMQPLRRIMEGLSTTLWLAAAAFVVIALLGSLWLYPWVATSFPGFADSEAHASLFHVAGGSKSQFMVWWRFLLMNSVIVAALVYLRHRLVGLSLAQDTTKAEIRDQHTRWAITFLIVFGIGFTFLIWDLLLALHVNWFSTMWGVYCFSSAVQTFLAVMLLLVLWLRNGAMKGLLPKHILHDLATWSVAWSCFCAYIGFSQYMLIYYANLDEETFWYVARTQHGYEWLLVVETVLRWPVPFLGLMSQSVRTCPRALVTVAILVLIGNWIDWSFIIMPAFSPNEFRAPWSPQELAVGAGFTGGMLLLALWFWRQHGVVAKGEKRVLAAVNAEHLH